MSDDLVVSYADDILVRVRHNHELRLELTRQGPQGPQGEKGDRGFTGKSAYELAVEQGFSGNLGDWLESLKGKPVQLRRSGSYVQWRLVGESTWQNLFPLLDIKGDKGDPGDEVELRVNSGQIQWRRGDEAWQNLIAILDLKGDPGEPVSLQTNATHIQWRLGSGAWQDLLPLTAIRGEDGDEIELRRGGDYVQWRLGTGSWTNLIPLADLKGDKGDEVELRVTATHIQWRLKGATWQNLIALSALQGPVGNNAWSPILAVEQDDERFVLRVVDWTGGTGAKPETGLYIGATGYVTNKADAANVRGAPGSGDMTKLVYDPTGVAGDAFNMDNMVEGEDTKIMTANERRKVSSVVYQPAVEPALDFVMSDPAAFLPEWFSRASGGTYFGPDGTLKLAESNEPRIEYDPSTGELLGLLVEEQRTNLMLHSDELGDSSWRKANTSLGSSIMIGGKKLVPLIEDTTLNRHFVHQSYSTTDDGTRYWCGSAVFKKYDAGSVRYPIVYVTWGGDPTGGPRAGIMVDLGNETTYPFTNVTATLVASGLEPLGDGVYRAWVCVQLGSETTGVRLVVGIRNSVGSGTLPTTHEGDGVSGIYLGMLQLEEGKYPTSYIPTDGAAVTRAPDFLTIPLNAINFKRWAGTVFADFRSYRPASAYSVTNDRAAIWSLSDKDSVSGHNSLDLIYSTQLFLLSRIDNNTSYMTSNIGAQPEVPAYEKVAVAFRDSEAKVSRNGGSVTNQTVSFRLEPLTLLRVGNDSVNRVGNRVLKGHMRRITYYPAFLPDDDLQSLTM